MATPTPTAPPTEITDPQDPNLDPNAPPADPPQDPPVDPNDPPVEETPPEEPTGRVIDDPLLASLKHDLTDLLSKDEPTEEKPIEPAPVDPPPADPPVDPKATPAPTPTPTPAPAAPAKAAKKKLSIVDPVITPPAPPQDATPTAAPAAERLTADEEYIQGLTEEQKLELQEAEFAEAKLGDKHKGRRKQLLDFYRKVDEAARTHAPDTEEFRKVLEAKPAMSLPDQRQVIRAMAEENARKSVRESVDPEIADIKMRQKRIEAAPQVESVVSQFGKGLHDLVVEEEALKPVAELIATKGLDAVKAEMPHMALEAQVIHDENVRAKTLAREYTLFANRLQAFNPQNPDHVWLSQFIASQGEHFKRTGGNSLVNGAGQRFVTRAEYGAMEPKERAKHFTFTHKQVLEMLALNAKAEVTERIKEEDARARSMGYERKKAEKLPETPKPNADPKPIEAARTRARPSPGAAAAGGRKPANADGIDVVSTLGLKIG
jgi:hypothetical protein